MDRNCQNCDKPAEAPWTLCKTCRREYARLLHRLRVNLHLLQAVARREYRLSEPGAGGRPQGGDAPAPINLHAQDMLDQTEDGLQDMWNETGVESRPRWQALLRDAPRRLPDLCRASRSGHWLTWLIHACERIEPLIDRRPRTRRIIGVCPECGREVLAAKGETLRLCKPVPQDPHSHRMQPMAPRRLRARRARHDGEELATARQTPLEQTGRRRWILRVRHQGDGQHGDGVFQVAVG